ncbi:hypothetical protein GQR58_023279 [Nymphon striatum]|nr:hypothetical protein GQR58_023279 [Nymphon striatum]
MISEFGELHGLINIQPQKQLEIQPFMFADRNDNVFYSRRIGRSPQGSVNSDNVAFSDSPNNSTILGAAKFSGKTKNWLESVTGKMFTEIEAPDGSRREELVEPLTNYLVGRAQKDFNQRNTFIGGIFTATNRRLPDNLNFLHKSAYAGGVDFKHNWNDRNYYIEGNMVASNVNGTAASITRTQQSLTHLFQRADASHVSVDENRTSLTGTGGKLEAGKIAEDINERVTLYNTNQISRINNEGSYLVDEDVDGIIDYEIDDPDFAFDDDKSDNEQSDESAIIGSWQATEFKATNSNSSSNAVDYLEINATATGLVVPCPTQSDTETSTYTFDGTTLTTIDSGGAIVEVRVSIDGDIMSANATDLDIPNFDGEGELIFEKI